ncbi:MAG TPA: ATP-dependent DNA helicase UvrD2 [Mycobacteriales bacterium]|jgi:DNA helicase-2/ATP-dependent DNA helicase PcrA|nr:ATP-dependent DNA helicase UvrD2 [Mycobacteriales bacterium]
MATDPLDRVLAGLDDEQRAAVTAPRGPVCILAGAGTGKTRAVTHRIAYQVLGGQVKPTHVLAVTFTTRAAGELRSRLRALGADGVQARTFHSAALRQLTYFWPRISAGARPTLLESKLPAVRAAAAACRLTAAAPQQRDLASEVEWAKAGLIEPSEYAARAKVAGREPPFDLDTVQAVFTAYEQVNAERGQLDFEDLLLLTAAAIESNPAIAGEVRERYRHFTVDEYQDVNPLQQRLLDAWLGDRDDLCVVGDPNQTIYSFTGASPDYLRQFATRYPGASVVRLVRDYRSTTQVVQLANRIEPESRLRAQAGDGPEPTFASYDDEPAEAAAVAQRVARLRDAGVPLREQAVLYRVNAQSEVYEAALADAGLPYVVRGGTRFFERREVREAMTRLRGAARPEAETEGESLPAIVADVLTAMGFSDTPPSGAGAARDTWESLRAIVGLAEEVEVAHPGADLPAFVAELLARADAQHAPPVEGVTLASLHAAKGLEWDAVHLVGLVDGTLPITHAATPAQVEEERRLLYVGVTRARRHLGLTWALARAPGGRRSRKPSRFLDGIRPYSEPAVRPKPAKPAKPELPDDPLFTRLREWRLQRAQDDGVAAFMVFDNKTLVAIADRAPDDRAGLAAVPGVGPKKLEQYAEEVLSIIRG